MRSFLAIASMSLLFVACGSNVENEDPAPRSTNQTLKYVGSCTPKACDGLPVLAMACAEPAKTTQVCSPGTDGACKLDIVCEGSGGSGSVSWEPCADSACGPIPAIGCADDATITQQCGKTNGGSCAWVTTCSPKPGELCAAGACGDGVPAVAPICSDGKTGSLECRKLGDRCGWVSDCK